jgi:RNA polymerase sigma factor (sigma-70 family)
MPPKAFMLRGQMMDAPTDERLSGGSEAESEAPSSFERFFRDEAPSLFRALYLVTGRSGEAEDIMQDAFLKVWQRWERVRSMDDPKGYLYRTSMNCFRSRYRSAVRATRHLVAPPATEDPFARVDRLETLARALKALAPRQRAALVLTEMLGFDATEAAGLLGVKPATVRSLASLAREALRAREGTDDE